MSVKFSSFQVIKHTQSLVCEWVCRVLAADSLVPLEEVRKPTVLRGPGLWCLAVEAPGFRGVLYSMCGSSPRSYCWSRLVAEEQC